MKLADRIKPISYLKAHAPEIIRTVTETQEPFIITLRGEGKVVVQDIASYEQTQETLALLKILSLSSKEIEAGDTLPVEEAFAEIRSRLAK